MFENVPSGNYQWQASSVGFNTIPQRIAVIAGQNLELAIEMTKDERLLDDVVVSATMKQVSRLNSPVAVEGYSAEFFKANPAPSVFESLQNVNGVRPQLK
ncbi:MAG: outer membrane receptor for ferrienterochelin and colicins [Roseivirga sp.]